MIIACPDCAAVQLLPAVAPGDSLRCWRCEATLERTAGRSADAALACASATFLLLIPANLMPVLRVSMLGTPRHSFLISGPWMMWQTGWLLLGVTVALQGIILPFFRFGLLTIALASLRRPQLWTGPVFAWAERLDAWAMPDVFLIGCAVGYNRVAPFLPINILLGGWCFIGAALLAMLTRATLDRRSIWRRIAAPQISPKDATLGCVVCDLPLSREYEGQKCPRCHTRVWRRKPFAMLRAIPLVIAGYLLYPIANIYPMSIAYQFGTPKPHTIFTGVLQLIHANLWPLAGLIFVASIGIPLLKLAGMTWFFISVALRSPRRLVTKTKLYRVIDEVGRWSNIDVFTIAVFMPLMQYGNLVNVQAAKGAMAFLSVVVLTMIAAQLFDPRLLWDAADEAQ